MLGMQANRLQCVHWLCLDSICGEQVGLAEVQRRMITTIMDITDQLWSILPAGFLITSVWSCPSAAQNHCSTLGSPPTNWRNDQTSRLVSGPLKCCLGPVCLQTEEHLLQWRLVAFQKRPNCRSLGRVVVWRLVPACAVP